MTSSVKVEAHCAVDKEVVVCVNSETAGEIHHLKDGEVKNFVIYDDLQITINEQVQSINEQVQPATIGIA